MGIRIADPNEVDFERLSKSERLKADIREIIDKKIEFCELTDFPYSKKTNLTDCGYIGMLCSIFHKLTGENMHNYCYRNSRKYEYPLVLKRIPDKDGNPHIYAQFDVNEWSRIITLAINQHEEKLKEND